MTNYRGELEAMLTAANASDIEQQNVLSQLAVAISHKSVGDTLGKLWQRFKRRAQRGGYRLSAALVTEIPSRYVAEADIGSGMWEPDANEW